MLSSSRFFKILSIAALAAFILPAHAESVRLSCDDQGNIKSAQFGKTRFSYAPSQREEVKLLHQSLNEACREVTGCYANIKELRSDLEKSSSALQHYAVYLAQKASLSSQRDELLKKLNILQSTLKNCERTHEELSGAPSKDTLSLSYPFKGPNQSKTGSNYDKARIERAVRLALLNGVDPNLAVGILMTENTPIHSKQSRNYAKKYGLLPINALPAYEYLGCLSPKGKSGHYQFATKEEAKVFRTFNGSRAEAEKQQKALIQKIGSELDDLDLKGDTTESHWGAIYKKECKNSKGGSSDHDKLCGLLKKYVDNTSKLSRENAKLSRMFKQLSDGDSARGELVLRELSCGADCAAYLIKQKSVPNLEVRTDDGPTKKYNVCTSDRTIGSATSPSFQVVKGDVPALSCCTQVEGSRDSELSDVAVDTKSALALKFMNEKIHSRTDKGLSVSNLIQTYNGTGVVNRTEKVKNSCLSGLDMGKTPVYGAKVADLMVNSIMNNSDIQEMIRQAAAEFHTPVRSLFCEKMGKGTHSIAAESFINEQRRYLLENGSARRAACEPEFK